MDKKPEKPNGSNVIDLDNYKKLKEGDLTLHEFRFHEEAIGLGTDGTIVFVPNPKRAQGISLTLEEARKLGQELISAAAKAELLEEFGVHFTVDSLEGLSEVEMNFFLEDE